MVDLEIRRPYFNEETRTIEWQIRAVVHGAPQGVSISAADHDVVVAGPLIEVATGETVDRESAPERWVRALANAYRTGDLVAVVVRDDDPPATDAVGNINEPVIPDAPEPKLDNTRDTYTEENVVTA